MRVIWKIGGDARQVLCLLTYEGLWYTLKMINAPIQTSPKAYHFMVPDDTAGQRIDNFLLSHLKGVPRTRVYRIVRKGEVRVNKGRVKPDYRLAKGDSIRIPPIRQSEDMPEPVISPRIEHNILSQILYEDEDLILLNKPSGMAVHGGSGLSYGIIEALRILKPEMRNLELIHRLDRDTSGCLLIAKRRSALKFMQAQLREQALEKRYLALLQGDWQGGKIVEAPLLKNQLSSGERMVRVHDEGKYARTEFKIVKKFDFATLMEIRLITGRTHQIRVHSQHAGHPVAGDPKYGDSDFNRLMKEKGLSRLFLHASAITFPLPQNGKQITVEAPLGDELSKLLENFNKFKGLCYV